VIAYVNATAIIAVDVSTTVNSKQRTNTGRRKTDTRHEWQRPQFVAKLQNRKTLNEYSVASCEVTRGLLAGVAEGRKTVLNRAGK